MTFYEIFASLILIGFPFFLLGACFLWAKNLNKEKPDKNWLGL